MSRLVLLLAVTWLSITAAQFLKSITKGINKEIQTITDPFGKAIVHVGFAHCKNVKKLLGVDYDAYNNTEPNLDDLTLNFITRGVNVTYKLTAAAELIPRSEWFDPRRPLTIYLHGFADGPSQGSYTKLNEAFLSRGDHNILALDASSLIRGFYLRSTTMVRFIGMELGKILAAMMWAGLHPSSIHLIGHSLGSHISGFAGKSFKTLTGRRVGRISGLDPAGPCFSDVNINLRLNIKDADFVDVIHTDAGAYGINGQVGHVDFYPNGGSQQPNCRANILLASCSHSRAWLLFAESVSNPLAFVATNCGGWQDFRNGKCINNVKSLMGYGCRPGTVGSYFLRTADESPYGLGMNGTRYVNNEGVLWNLGSKLFGWSSGK